MKRTIFIFALTWVVGMALGVIGDEVLSAQHFKSTALLRTELQVAPGKEVIVSLVEVTRDGTIAKHYHPGEEFLYIVEGSLILSLEGKPDVTLKQGETYHIPYKKVHSAKTGMQAAKAVVFRVHEKGQPERIAVQ